MVHPGVHPRAWCRQYEVTIIRRGVANDRVSDLNCFWMAAGGRRRSGKFADYNDLRAYYVGQGGNGNTTTRFRRCIGDPVLRPLLPEHDLTAPLLEANVPMKIGWWPMAGAFSITASGGWCSTFATRRRTRTGGSDSGTTFSHVEIRHFRVYRPLR
jgi:hypothetical protein